MPSSQNPYRGYLIAGVIILFVFGAHLLMIALQNENIWWTHRDMKESLDENRDNVEIFVKDKMLQDTLADGELVYKSGDETVQLNEDDIGLRINHKHEIKADQIWRTALIAFFTGIASMWVLHGMMPYFAKRKNDEQSTE